MHTGTPGHLRSFDYVGPYRYFLTFCTLNRAAVFTSADAVHLVREQILRAATTHGMATPAYCFMPDHLHVLAEGASESTNALSFIKCAKQLSGFHYKRRFGRKLWQRYGFERVLRGDEETLSVARYIVENPVRAGLVKRADEYPFVGSDRYAIREILEAVQMKRRST